MLISLTQFETLDGRDKVLLLSEVFRVSLVHQAVDHSLVDVIKILTISS